MKKVILSNILLLGLVLLSAGCSSANPETNEAGDIVFSDDFSDIGVGSWQIENDELGSTYVRDGQLVVQVDALNTIQYTTLKEPAFDDFSLEVDATMIDGDPGSSLGVLFRLGEETGFYRFEVTADGRFMIERRNTDGSWTRFVDDWQQSNALLPGLNVTNRLGITADGAQMAFFANGELLTSIEDSTYLNGKIAMDAGTFGHPRLRAAFDNLLVSAP